MDAVIPARFLVPCLAAVAAAALACSSSTPAPEQPSSTGVDTTAPETDPSATPGDGPPDTGDEPKTAAGKKNDSIPDDYEMTNGDCSVLGKHMGQVQKNDQMAALSPKLKPAQREQAEVNIDKVTAQNGQKWAAGCQDSLVGKVVDPRNLKCALGAKTVKDFDTCINGPPPEPQPKP